MSNEEKAAQLGQLMLNKQASKTRLEDLKVKARNIGRKLQSIGELLSGDPAQLVFPGDSVDIRFQQAQHIADGRLESSEDIRALTVAIRAEQLKLWEYERDLKNLGF